MTWDVFIRTQLKFSLDFIRLDPVGIILVGSLYPGEERWLLMADNIIVAIYLVGILALGIGVGKGIRTLREYSVCNRSFSAMVIFATLSASFIGGGFSIGNAEKVFLFGIMNIVALWGFSLSQLLVARFMAPRIDRFEGFISVGDIMEPSYGRMGKVITGIFAVMLCAGIVGAQVGAISKIFSVFLGMKPVWGILIGCGIVISYSTVGGMKSVVYTDVAQFILLIIGIPLVLFIGVGYAGGLKNVLDAAPQEHFRILPEGTKSLIPLISLFLTFLVGETLVPPYVQRLFVGKNAAETSLGTYLSGIVSIPFFLITGAIGLVALAINPDVEASLAMPYVIRTVLPLGIKGLVIAGMISVVMSSADSFLNAASVSFVNDVVQPLRRHPLVEKAQLHLARIITVAVGVASIIFALMIKSVLDILIFAYNFWAPAILIPLVAAILGIKAAKKSFLAAAVCGIVSAVVWDAILKSPGGFSGLVLGVFVNLFVFLIVRSYENRKSEKVAGIQ